MPGDLKSPELARRARQRHRESPSCTHRERHRPWRTAWIPAWTCFRNRILVMRSPAKFGRCCRAKPPNRIARGAWGPYDARRRQMSGSMKGARRPVASFGAETPDLESSGQVAHSSVDRSAPMPIDVVWANFHSSSSRSRWFVSVLLRNGGLLKCSHRVSQAVNFSFLGEYPCRKYGHC
jgi:hypothetical protein